MSRNAQYQFDCARAKSKKASRAFVKCRFETKVELEPQQKWNINEERHEYYFNEDNMLQKECTGYGRTE